MAVSSDNKMNEPSFRFSARCLKFVRVLAIFFSCAPSTSSVLFAQAKSAREYEVKAGYLYNFARFVYWPANAFSDPKQPVCVCIYGRDPFGHSLEDALLGKTIGDRPVILGHALQLEDLSGCQIIFVGGFEHAPIGDLATRLRGRAVLLVGESEGFAASGGAIQLRVEDGRVRLIINPDAADRAGLKISSKLLALARIVHDSDRSLAGSALPGVR
jgi:hypothetical protein